MVAPALLLEQDGPIALLTFNRPDNRNALDAELMVPLADAWDVIRVTSNIKAVLLTGTNGIFSLFSATVFLSQHGRRTTIVERP